MIKRIIFPVLCGVFAAAQAQGPDSNAPEWVYKTRIVSVQQKPRKGKFSVEKLKEQLDDLKKGGVNTIMAHGSLQFLPDLPSGHGQWKDQVDYSIALPYSNAVKDAGFRLFHHTTSTFAPIEAMDNPEYRPWLSCDIRTGKPSLRPAGTGYSDACFMDMNHPDFRKKIFTRMAEYVEKCRVDAWMTDEVEWLADIYACGSAGGSKPLYQKRFGKGYPEGSFDPSKPEWREYITFRYDSGGDFYRELLETLRRANPQMQLSGCLAGISKYHRRIWAMGNENWLKGWSLGFFEMEEAHHPRKKPAGYLSTTFWPTYYREMALYNANGEANNWPCSYSLGYPSTWKVENSEQFYLWAMNLTMGFRFWMRDYQAEPQWFAWEEKFEKDLVKPRLISDIGVFFPEESRDFAVNPIIPYHNWSGISETLAWHNIPADQLIRAHFEDISKLGRFKLIIMPSNEFISDKMAEVLHQFVNAGGILIAVGECANQDPYTTKQKTDRIQPLIGISGASEWHDGSISFKYKDQVHIYPDGMMRVTPLPTAKVLASVKDVGPALIENKVGKGRVYYFTGRWGAGMFNQNVQKGPAYKPTFRPAQRQLLADLVNGLLENQRRTEVRNLPAKIMFNAYDTDGDFDGKYKRTLHLLDSFDGYEPGETFPETNQPCRFKPFAERNAGKNIEFILRDVKSVGSVKMISPDFTAAKPLKAVYSDKDRGYLISVPAAEFGRYTIIIVDTE